MAPEIEREIMETDVLIVGGGPAGLATAYQLKQLEKKENERRQSEGKDPISLQIMLIDKGPSIGAHNLSGAVMDPAPLLSLIPDAFKKGMPVETTVEDEKVLFLTQSKAFAMPITPPGMHNKGLPIVSIGRLCEWMAGLLEEMEIDVLPGFAGKELLKEDGRITGVRTDDKGLDSKGEPKSNFEPGVDIKAKVTVLAEGVRGFLSKQLPSSNQRPMQFETGVKEIYKIKPNTFKKGTAIHTFGYPLNKNCSGGGFIYTMKDDHLVIGFVVSLDCESPLMDPHACLQAFKRHPFVKSLLEGAEPVAYGAKALSAGGYHSLPDMAHDGALLVGESAGLLNPQRLKGIHLAVASGAAAAETILEAFKADDFSKKFLSSYKKKVLNSAIGKELYRSRNFHQALGKGMPTAAFHLAAQTLTGGRGFIDPMPAEEDRKTTLPLSKTSSTPPCYEPKGHDGKFQIRKLDDVYMSGTKHEEDQPSHIIIKDKNICMEKCLSEYGAPCTHFCPAQVYELVETEDNVKKLQVSFTNCVHCQTCDIKCPLNNITWTPPEGGQGPNYEGM